jgi:hypothetical protein
MKCSIVMNDWGSGVKVWLYNDDPHGRIFLWPIGYENGSTAMTWQQELVPEGQCMPDTIRPALEMSRQIWEAFKEALLADFHLRVDALDIVAKTLEREQTRVDVLIQALIKQGMPQYMLSSEVPHG